MIKILAMAFASVLTLSAAQVHPLHFRSPAPIVAALPSSAQADDLGLETLAVYYSPLASTEFTKFIGFGTAYHMAIVYTDAAGQSYGASSGPTNFRTEQTATHALVALASAVDNAPSAFGTLAADPHNNTVFIRDARGDVYTRDGQGHAYQTTLVKRGRDLSGQWRTIIRTYDRVGRLHLTYSPISQNSNSLATTALREAGLSMEFSSGTSFTPGSFTQLPNG